MHNHDCSSKIHHFKRKNRQRSQVMPGCDNDIQHLMLKCPVKPNIAYSFRDDTLIMAFVRSGLGVTISQELVMQAFGCGCPGVVSRPLEPACCRTLGLAFSKTASLVVSQTLLDYLQSAWAL